MTSVVNPYESTTVTIADDRGTTEQTRPSGSTFFIILWLCESTLKLGFIGFALFQGVNLTNMVVRWYDSSSALGFLAVCSFAIVETIGPVIGIYVLLASSSRGRNLHTVLLLILRRACLWSISATLTIMAAIELLVPKS